MKKFYLFAVVAAAFVAGCTKDENGGGSNPSDEEKLKPNQRKVYELLEKAGKLPVSEPKTEYKTTADTLPGVIKNYQDPYSHNKDVFDARCVETTTEYDVVSNPEEFVTLNPWSNLYPGALVQGASLAKGIPTLISIYDKRRPGRIYLSLTSGSDMDDWYKEVPMRASEVIQAQNRLLAEHFRSKATTDARTSFEIACVSSVDEMALKLGINLKLFGARMHTEFGNNFRKDRSYVAVKLHQTFFTMGYDAPDGGFAGVFTDNITPQDLANYTGFGNPICYVSSVSYGRMFILIYESSRTQQELEVAVNVGYRKFFDSELETRSRKVLNESRCKMIQIGGNPEAGLATVFGDFDKLQEFIINGANVSTQNVGAPISYSIKYLHDNTDAQLSNTLKYKVTTRQYYPVKAYNDVNLDLLKLKVSRIRPKKKRLRVSTSYTYAKITSVRLKMARLENGKYVEENIIDRVRLDEVLNKKYSNGYGVEIPFGAYCYCQAMNANDRITLEVDVEVHNSCYWLGYTSGTEIVTLQRTFECNRNKQWSCVDTDVKKGDEFSSIKVTRVVGGAEVDLDLQIRFSQDGIVLGRQ